MAVKFNLWAGQSHFAMSHAWPVHPDPPLTILLGEWLGTRLLPLHGLFPFPSPATLERRHEDMKRSFWSQRAICDFGWAQTVSKILEGAKLLYHSNSGGKGVGLLIFVVLGMWTLDRVTSGVGAATWFLGQLWWHALLDMDHIMGGKWYW